MARLFVAAYPPAEVVENLMALERHASPNVRWVPPEQWHVTLQFFGAVDEGLAVDAFGNIRSAPTVAKLGARVGRLGATQ
ncbi:MAG: 2'-5' RNA ligase family protein [Ilumatobacteraceae bacterium]